MFELGIQYWTVWSPVFSHKISDINRDGNILVVCTEKNEAENDAIMRVGCISILGISFILAVSHC